MILTIDIPNHLVRAFDAMLSRLDDLDDDGLSDAVIMSDHDISVEDYVKLQGIWEGFKSHVFHEARDIEFNKRT